MPYKLGSDGKTIYTKASGRWRKKQTAKSRVNAVKALRLLRGLESGSIKPSQVGKKRSVKGKGLKDWKKYGIFRGVKKNYQ